ncbi:MAG: antibiotic biosynthesis monooxygenase [Rhodospirillales bacterium]|nr:antibiotic biosynthesis monooxygenase [Rhodospirillales bacterium]
MSFADTPEPPYYAVIFTARNSGIDPAGYGKRVGEMLDLATKQPGYLGAESVTQDNVEITVSYWKDKDSIRGWRDNAEHKVSQQMGRDTWYDGFHLRVALVERASTFPR